MSLEQKPSGRMTPHRDVRVGERLRDAFGHLGVFHLKPAVDRAHDEVEALEQIGVVVERAVGQNVALDAVEDADP